MECCSCLETIKNQKICNYCNGIFCKNCINRNINLWCSNKFDIGNICTICVNKFIENVECKFCKKISCWKCHINQEKTKIGMCEICILFCNTCQKFINNDKTKRCNICKIRQCLCNLENSICKRCLKKLIFK